MKALLFIYNIEVSIIHEAWNAKDLCIVKNSGSDWLGPLADFASSLAATMMAAGPVLGKLVPDRVDQQDPGLPTYVRDT